MRQKPSGGAHCCSSGALAGGMDWRRRVRRGRQAHCQRVHAVLHRVAQPTMRGRRPRRTTIAGALTTAMRLRSLPRFCFLRRRMQLSIQGCPSDGPRDTLTHDSPARMGSLSYETRPLAHQGPECSKDPGLALVDIPSSRLGAGARHRMQEELAARRRCSPADRCDRCRTSHNFGNYGRRGNLLL